MKLRALIVDDEKDAIDVVHNIIENNTDDVIIAGETTDPLDAVNLISRLNPDVLFLDIEMPEMNGFELLEKFPNRNFEVVFITAYDSFAIKAFKAHAVDYLLKPVNVPDLLHAIESVKTRITNKENSQLQKIKNLFNDLYRSNNKKIVIKRNEGIEYVSVKDIIRIEADRNYSTIFIQSGESLIVSKPISDIELELNDETFFRSHKSHLINLTKVKRLSAIRPGEIIMQDNSIAQLSRRKRDEFLEIMERFA